ncbi:MAG: transporter [Pseudomonadales bacterium]|nr:transporter [Pseudomonadales bacterium]
MTANAHLVRTGCALILILLPALTLAAPHTFNTSLPVAQNEFVWRPQLILRESSDNGPLNRDVSTRALDNTLGYGITPDLALFVTLPYFFEKKLRLSTPTGRVTRKTEGLGDTSVFARYTLHRSVSAEGAFSAAPFVGITAPTGDDDDRDQRGELPRSLQAGDGAWDGFVGVTVTYQTRNYQLDGQILQRENGRHNGYAAGDETRLDGSLQYRLGVDSRRKGATTPHAVYALLEYNLVYRQHDELNGRETDSGGLQWLVTPGLQFVSRHWTLEGSVQLPMIDDPHGDATTDDAVWRLGFRRNF